jgi:DNA-directed RNA polymerase specialized sigma24 family protein
VRFAAITPVLLDPHRYLVPRSDLGPWLATIARRECLALIAHRQAERATDMSGEDRVSSASTPEALALVADEHARVPAAAAELPRRSVQLLDALSA